MQPKPTRIAPKALEFTQGDVILDAFCDDAESEVVRQRNDRFHDALISGRIFDVFDEHFVDLQFPTRSNDDVIALLKSRAKAIPAR